MKDKNLKNIYGKPPVEFHNAIISTLNTLPETSASTKQSFQAGKKKPIRFGLVCATVALAALATVGVYAVTSSIMVNQTGKYSINTSFDAESSVDNNPVIDTKYAEINFAYLPEDMKYSPYEENFEQGYILRYQSTKDSNMRFMITLSHPENNYIDQYYVGDYEVVEKDDMSYIFTQKKFSEDNGVFPNYKAIHRYLKNSNLLISLEAMPEFPTDELKKIIEGISLAPTDEIKDESKTVEITVYEDVYGEDDENSTDDSDNNSDDDSVVTQYFEVKQNTPFTIEEFDGTISVGNVKFFDNINDFDGKYFYPNFLNGVYSPIDKNGNMISTEYILESLGDGQNTIGKTLGTTKTKLQFVTAEITLNNTTDYDQNYYAENLCLNDSDNRDLYHKYGMRTYAYGDGLIYLKDDRELDFNDAETVEIPANSSKTITVGFITDELGAEYQQLNFVKKSRFEGFAELNGEKVYTVLEDFFVKIKE